MTNSITNRQMFFILFLTLTTYTAIGIAKVMVENANTGCWIPILVMALIFAVAVTTIVRLNNMFQGKVLFDYSREIVGKFPAYVLGIYFILYFLLLGIYLNVQVVNMIRAEFYPETPQWATLLLGIPVFGFMAYKGVTNVARLFEIYGIIFITAAVTVHVIMFTQGMGYSIFPLFNKADMGQYAAALKDAVFPFLGIEILTIIPFTQKNGKKATKAAFFTLIAIGLFYVMVVESTVKIAGFHNITSYKYPLIEAVRLADIPFFERGDILYLTMGFFGLIAGITIVYLAIVEYACRVFAKAKRAVIVIITGAVLTAACLFALGIKDLDIFLDYFTFMGLVSAILIPTVLFVIARVKKRAGKIR
ncbi:MAG: GerAB/ArcD/ProY family transporter [Bacillota bacterium]